MANFKIYYQKIIFSFLILLFANANLSAFSLSIDYGQEQNEDFSVLTIIHNKPFYCKKTIDNYGNLHNYNCEIEGYLDSGFTNSSSEYFKFNYKVVGNKFLLFIYPKFKSEIFPVYGNLQRGLPIVSSSAETARVIEFNTKRTSKEWQIIGFKDKMPFLNPKKPPQINYPIEIKNIALPYIPNLDTKRDGLNYKEGDDFMYFNNVKLAYDKAMYTIVVNQVDIALKTYKGSIFTQDFILYRLKALDKLGRDFHEEIVKDSLQWLNIYPTSQYTPEVLYILANAYIKNNNKKDAIYYYERLINEYKDSKYSILAKIEMAQYFPNTTDKKPTELFKETLDQAKDKNTASEILLKWALYNRNSNKNISILLINKILENNPSYLLQNVIPAYNTAISLASAGLYGDAAKIGSYIVRHSFPNAPLIDKINNSTAIWYEKNNDLEASHAMNLRYLENYPKKEEAKEVRERDDKLLFGLDRNNEEKLKIYDYIIATYPNSQNAKTAIDMKAQLFFDEGKYEEVLKMQKVVPDYQIVLNTYQKLYEKALEENNCKKIVDIMLNVKDFKVDKKFDLQTAQCLYNLGFNKMALNISKGLANNAKDLKIKLQWLYFDAKNYLALGNIKESRASANDAFMLATTLNNKPFLDVGFILFDDLMTLGELQEALAVTNQLEKIYSDDLRLAKVYNQLMNAYINKKEYTLTAIYANKLITLEERLKNDDYLVMAYFVFIDALNRTNKPNEALKAISELLKLKLTNNDLQKALYLQGSLFDANNETQKAKESFQNCIKNKPINDWGNLCNEALKLMEN